MRKKDKSEINLKKFALFAALILAIGYAIVTTTIIAIKISPTNMDNNRNVNDNNSDNTNNNNTNNNDNYYTNNNGSHYANNNDNNNSGKKEKKDSKIKTDFDVYYISDETSPYIESGVGTAEISNDKRTAIFSFSGMTRKGDTAVVKYTIYNNSSDTDANLNVRLTNSNSEYFKVDKRLGKSILPAKEKTTVTIMIELLVTPIDREETATITGIINATPVE